MRGRLKDLTFGAHGEQHITITVTSDFRESYDALKDSDINVEIKKWRKPRSRDANAYASLTKSLPLFPLIKQKFTGKQSEKLAVCLIRYASKMWQSKNSVKAGSTTG